MASPPVGVEGITLLDKTNETLMHKLQKNKLEILKLLIKIGVEIVKKVEDLINLCAHILCHHLKYNGGGYPALRFEYDPVIVKIFIDILNEKC